MNTDFIDEFLARNLSEKRQKHIEGVRVTAIALAKRYGKDPEKADLCARFHDMYKERDLDDLIDHYGIPARYKGNRNLAHSKVAAAAMAQDFGISDQDMLNAVSYHTTGRPAMSKLEQILYLADTIEPNRDYPGVEELRKTAERDLDRACLLALSRSVDYVRAGGQTLDEDTLHARDYYAELLKEKRMDSRTVAKEAAKALSDKLGKDIIVIDVSKESSFADYLVIATAGSGRQAEALADEVDDRLAAMGENSRGAEGRGGSGWILLDFGDVIVHVFSEEMRDLYNIESIWGDCEQVDWEAMD